MPVKFSEIWSFMSIEQSSPNRPMQDPVERKEPHVLSLQELLCQLISIPSCNPMGAEVAGEAYFENRLSDWLVEYLASFGVPVERIPVFFETDSTPRRDNVFALFENPNSSRVVLLDAHQDTVPIEGMTIPPFAPTVRGGRIYGRGAVDVKGGMASMLYAFARLCQERPEGAANVIMSCSCDEEATAQGVQHLVGYWEKYRNDDSPIFKHFPSEAVIAEPTELNVVVAHRGVVRFCVETRGRACHSSQTEQGDNAIYRMAQVIEMLCAHAKQLEQSANVHPRCGGARLSVGKIQGGTAVNIVPDHCTIEVDRRLIPGEDPDQVFQEYRRMLSALGDAVHVCDPWLISLPLADDDNEKVSGRLMDQIEAVTGKACHRIGVPFGTNASTIAKIGIPSVVFGPGSIQQAHTIDEWIEMSQVEKAAEILFRYLVAS